MINTAQNPVTETPIEDDSPKFQELGATEPTLATNQSTTSNAAAEGESSNFRRDIMKYLPLFNSANEKIQSYLFQSSDYSFRNSIRSPILFFGPGHFTKPNGMKQVTKRFYQNGKYFLANYILFMLLMSILWVLTSPMALIGVILLSAFWIGTNRTETISLGKVTLSGRNKMIVSSVIMLFGVLWLGILDALIFGSTMGAVGSVAHAVTHKTQGEIEGTDDVQSAVIGDHEMDLFLVNGNDPELGQQT